MGSAGAAAAAEQVDAERAFIAAVFARGLSAVAELVGAPIVLSDTHRTVFDAAVQFVRDHATARPLPVAGVIEEVRRAGGDIAARQAQEAVEVAIEGYGGGTPSGSVAKLASVLADLNAAQDERGSRLLEAAKIFAPLPPVRWMCQALDVAPGPPLLIAGYGYSGKSIAAQDLALAVATGTTAWGRFPVRAGRVLHLDYEQGSYLTRLRYQRLARARGIDPATLRGCLTLAPLPAWYLDGDAQDELVRVCEGVDLVVVDSFRAACPRTKENDSEARAPLDRLTRLAEQTGSPPR